MGIRQTLNIVGLCFGLWIATLPVATAQSASEYSIKAAYLLLFTRYAEWPASAFATTNAPITICILGENPFDGALMQTTAGQQSQDRPIEVRRLAGVEDSDGCHIVFISAREAHNAERWLTALADRPVLTVAEDPSAFAHGVVISFVAERKRDAARIRFEASLPAMERAGLKISAQMLVAARKVHRDTGA